MSEPQFETAVPRKIYRAFATYLAGQGFAVLGYDYRGIGGSRPASLRGLAVRMRDWAALDVAAAIDHVRGVWPSAPLHVVGHSFGGQAVGLAPNNEAISRALFVAATLPRRVARDLPPTIPRRRPSP